MIYTGSSEEIKRLLDGRREEIVNATLRAREAVDTLLRFCYDPSEIERFNQNSEDPELRNRVLGKDYLFKMLNAYIGAGQNRKGRMGEFAENMQRPYSQIKDVLDFLGLESESTAPAD